jgi:hypothetical protein
MNTSPDIAVSTLNAIQLLRVDECVWPVAEAENGFQAAGKKRFTVSPHCPREVSPEATSPGHERDRYLGGPIRKAIR